MSSQQVFPAPSVFSTYIRGGTSKALFFHEKDLPSPGPVRDEFLIRVMGSPDPNQIDGMGGTRIVTSKVAIVRPSKRRDADVDYTFAQIGLGEASVTYTGNCGNISSGVGPFAINEGLLKSNDWKDGNRVVRIFNTGREALLVAHVPIDKSTGRALEKGDFAISGCPGTGAPILMDYSRTAKPDTILPTGHVIDQLDCSFGKVDATFCTVGNPIVFIDASSVHAVGNETSEAVNANAELVSRIKEVRGRFAQSLGECTDWQAVDEQSPMLPMVAFVSKPTSQEGHLQSRLMLDNHCHQSMAGTGGICTTAVSRIPGSVVNRLLTLAALTSDTLQIQHPAGHLPVRVSTTQSSAKDRLPTFDMLAFSRTARYLFQGQLFVPADILDHWKSAPAIPVQNASTVAGKAQDEQAIDHPASTTTATDDSVEQDIVTEKLVAFIHDTKFENISSEALQRLRQCLLDFMGVTLLGARVGESTPHILAGISSLTTSFPSTHTVIGNNLRFPPQYAALLNGALAHTPDFDDTHTGGVIHVGATVIAAALTEAQSHPSLSYQDFLLALAVGYEVSIRISIALGVSAWHRGFHPTSVAGIYGAVASLCVLRHLDTTTIANALGLAVSFASGSMQYLDNGAWNKRLHPGKAAHDAFLVVVMAQAGVKGATHPVEGKFGLVAAHTDAPRNPVPVDGLGRRWELINTGLKPYPACRVTHTSIELAATLAAENKGRKVKGITITMDPATFPIVGVAQENKIHPVDAVDAQFSAFYQTAVAYLHGDGLGWDAYDHLQDAEVQELCGKINIRSEVVEEGNDLATRMEVEFEDGGRVERLMRFPKWQEPQRPVEDGEVINKFEGLAAPTLGSERLGQVVGFVRGAPDADVGKLVGLLGA